jgi:hypothetical protein
MDNTTKHSIRKLALGLALLVAPLAGCAQHQPQAHHAAPCRRLPVPQHADYQAHDVGVWLVQGRPYGYALAEDSDIWSAPRCTALR